MRHYPVSNGSYCLLSDQGFLHHGVFKGPGNERRFALVKSGVINPIFA